MPAAGATRMEAIRKAVKAFNRQRPEVERAMYMGIARTLLPFALLVAAIAILALVEGAPGISLIVIALAVLIGFGLRRLILRPVTTLKEKNREQLLPVIYAFIDAFRYLHDETPDVMPWLKKIDIIPFDTSLHAGTITGRHDGAAFTLTETELLAQGERHDRVLFDGTLLHFRRDGLFPGTFVAEAPGSAEDAEGEDDGGEDEDEPLYAEKGLHDIGGPEGQPDEPYRYRSTNTVAAEALVRGPLGAVLRRLSAEWRGPGFGLVLSNHDCYLLLPGRTRVFELPAIGEDIDVELDVAPMIQEMSRFMDLIGDIRRIG